MAETAVHDRDRTHVDPGGGAARPADVDGDADLDIVSIRWGHRDVLLYENRAPSRRQAVDDRPQAVDDRPQAVDGRETVT